MTTHKSYEAAYLSQAIADAKAALIDGHEVTLTWTHPDTVRLTVTEKSKQPE